MPVRAYAVQSRAHCVIKNGLLCPEIGFCSFKCTYFVNEYIRYARRSLLRRGGGEITYFIKCFIRLRRNRFFFFSLEMEKRTWFCSRFVAQEFARVICARASTV